MKIFIKSFEGEIKDILEGAYNDEPFYCETCRALHNHKNSSSKCKKYWLNSKLKCTYLFDGEEVTDVLLDVGQNPSLAFYER